MQVNQQQKTVSLWLTKAEQGDCALQQSVGELCAACHAQRYKVAVFCSGERELYTQTQGLLLHNRVAARGRMEDVP